MLKVIQCEDTHTCQSETKYRTNFGVHMADEVKRRIGEFPANKDIKVTIRIESLDSDD